jgi:hypothetical protein
MSPARIELHIEELVLDGFAPQDRHRIAQAVARELEELLTVNSLPASPVRDLTVERTDAGALHIPGNAQPAAFGLRIARSLYHAIRQ